VTSASPESFAVSLDKGSYGFDSHLANVITDNIPPRPTFNFSKTADLASGDERSREALADNGHEPDAFAQTLRNAASRLGPPKSPLHQLVELYA